jgi:hypothetical protein
VTSAPSRSPQPVVPSGPPSAPPPPAVRPERTFSIPTGYGDTRIVLLVKDPWWLHAYWEIQSETERAARRQLLPPEIAGLTSILRVYDVTDVDFPAQPAHRSFDISLSGLATNWYIQTDAPNRSFLVDIGLLTRQGRFLLLARSNRVTTPRFGPSEVIDEAWACSEDDYWRLFGATAGLGMGSSAAGFKKALMERRLFSPGFSGSLFSPVKAQKARGFWLWVDAELIVYGATDPKATVTIQGQPIKLRPDGTFSVRMALPDGTQTIPVEATAPDGLETRTLTPTVNRQTTGQSMTRAPISRPEEAKGF